jgi:alpha-tubulin suppressor-like RCC1 family protein
MHRARTFLVWISLAASTTAAVVACGEDPVDQAMARGDAGRDLDAAEMPVVDAGKRRDADSRAPFDPADEAVTCAGDPCAVELVAGDVFFCARMSDATVRCWGNDDVGSLGRANWDPKHPEDAGSDGGWVVSTVKGLSGVKQLSAAGATACARLEEGGVVCWGSNEFGQLGLSSDPGAADQDRHPEAVPVVLARDVDPVRVDVGHRGACIVGADGKVTCWGSNEQEQLARPSAPPDAVLGPAEADIGTLAVTRALPADHTTLTVTPTGEVWTWGALVLPFGTVGGRVASISPDEVPGRVLSLANVTSLAVSAWIEDFTTPGPPRAHACAIADGEVYCWGTTYRSALCTGVPDSSRTPVRAPLYTSAWPQQVSVADEITCVRMTDGTVSCCGEDGRGRLGTGSVRSVSNGFVPATALKGRAVHVAAGNVAVCALMQGGTVECWGGNRRGELGQPDTDDLDHPSPLLVRF